MSAKPKKKKKPETRGRPRRNKPASIITLRLEPEVCEKFDAKAKKLGLSRPQMMEKLVE